jgi:hypothetical protein
MHDRLYVKYSLGDRGNNAPISMYISKNEKLDIAAN